MDIEERLFDLEKSLNQLKKELGLYLYYIDDIEIPPALYTNLSKVVECIDYDRIIKCLSLFDWYNKEKEGEITKQSLRKTLINLCIDCYDGLMYNDDTNTYSMTKKGWYVQCTKYDDDIIINVMFSIETISSSSFFD